MNFKTEMKKFGVSSIFTFILTFYYNTNQFRNDFLDGLSTSTIGVFVETNAFFASILFYLIGYLIFILFYISINFLFKFIKVKISVLISTILIISVSMLIYFLNNHLIFYQLKEYKYSDNYYTPLNHETNEIDSLNFRKYTWENKFADQYVIKKMLTFKTDSTVTMSGTEMVYDKFYLIRKLLNQEHEFEKDWKYLYGNSLVLFDSLNTYLTVQIVNNRLFVNRYFYN